MLSICSDLLNLASAPAEVFNLLLDDFLEVSLAILLHWVSFKSPPSLLQVSSKSSGLSVDDHPKISFVPASSSTASPSSLLQVSSKSPSRLLQVSGLVCRRCQRLGLTRQRRVVVLAMSTFYLTPRDLGLPPPLAPLHHAFLSHRQQDAATIRMLEAGKAGQCTGSV